MKKTKRIIALAIVIIWGLLIVSTLVTALINTPATQKLFSGLIIIDILLPIVAYAMMLAYKLLSQRNK